MLCKAQWEGYLNEVYFEFNKKVCVDLLNRTCTCREWDISGIPCVHAMRSILSSQEDPMPYVDPIYKRQAFEDQYSPIINHVLSWHFLPQTSENIDINPPEYGRRSGRPKNSRNKSTFEKFLKKKTAASNVDVGTEGNPYKLKKVMMIRCGYRKEHGHNQKGCKKKKEATSNTHG